MAKQADGQTGGQADRQGVFCFGHVPWPMSRFCGRPNVCTALIDRRKPMTWLSLLPWVICGIQTHDFLFVLFRTNWSWIVGRLSPKLGYLIGICMFHNDNCCPHGSEPWMHDHRFFETRFADLHQGWVSFTKLFWCYIIIQTISGMIDLPRNRYAQWTVNDPLRLHKECFPEQVRYCR